MGINFNVSVNADGALEIRHATEGLIGVYPKWKDASFAQFRTALEDLLDDVEAGSITPIVRHVIITLASETAAAEVAASLDNDTNVPTAISIEADGVDVITRYPDLDPTALAGLRLGANQYLRGLEAQPA